MKHILTTILTLFLLVVAYPKPSLEKTIIELGAAEHLGNDQGEEDLKSFFVSLQKGDLSKMYGFASDKFKENFPKEYFLREMKDFSIEKISVVAVEPIHDTGFCLIIKYEAPLFRPNGKFETFYWKIDDGRAKFLHLPFRESARFDLHPEITVYETN